MSLHEAPDCQTESQFSLAAFHLFSLPLFGAEHVRSDFRDGRARSLASSPACMESAATAGGTWTSPRRAHLTASSLSPRPAPGPPRQLYARRHTVLAPTAEPCQCTRQGALTLVCLAATYLEVQASRHYEVTSGRHLTFLRGEVARTAAWPSRDSYMGGGG